MLAFACLLLALVALMVATSVRERFALEQTAAVRAYDGMTYRVHAELANAQGAADSLATLNARTTDLMRWLRRRYGSAAAARDSPARAAAVSNLLRRYNPDNLAENSPLDPTGDRSDCLDKGAVIALCLRSRGPARHVDGQTAHAPPAGALHDIDTLTFVTLHELAHAAIDDIDHPPRFWSTFKFLLNEAALAGIYRSPDYSAAPIDYCGVHVSYNPALDPGLQSI